MAKIPDDIVTDLESTDIVSVLEELGVTLHKRGAQLVGLCPFPGHNDRHLGSFQVSKLRNICSCYGCGNTGIDPVNLVCKVVYGNLPDKEAYGKALRWLADMRHIYIDEESHFVGERPMPKAKEIEDLPTRTWSPKEMVLPFMKYQDRNPLLYYLRCLPLDKEHAERLEQSIKMYMVGTYPHGYYQSNTIWWYINEQGEVYRGKVMPYKGDGHRDKQKPTTWVHSILEKQGKFDREKEALGECLFGAHLLAFPELKDAKVCVVESEKTALFCSAFTSPRQMIWLATGGLGNLKASVLQVLIDQGRTIILYPDIDGYDKWRLRVANDKVLSAYPKLIITNQVRELWVPEDGEKADIADIMIRIVLTQTQTQTKTGTQTQTQTQTRRVFRKEYVTPVARPPHDEYAAVADLIDKLKLTVV